MGPFEYPSVRNAFLKYAMKDQKAVRRVQVEQVGSSGVKLGQLGSIRVKTQSCVVKRDQKESNGLRLD